MEEYEIIYIKRGMKQDFRVKSTNILDAIYKCYQSNGGCIVDIVQVRLCN